MIIAELNEDTGILEVRPTGKLEVADFERLGMLADPYIERHGELPGLLLQIDKFPGWENFAGMIKHFRFVREHHKKVRRIAIVTDTPAGKVAENVFNHFVAATIKTFPAGHADEARAWILGLEAPLPVAGV